MRNKTAFIFVFFANLILLAHAVIPHHHHQDFPLKTFVTCEHKEAHHHHINMPACDHDHQHDKTTTCVIQAMIIPGEQIRGRDIAARTTSNDELFWTPCILNLAPQDNSFGNSFEIAESIPLYSRLLISCQGLRAPPVC